MKAEGMIAVVQQENREMKELIEFANRELAGLYNALDGMKPEDVKGAIAFIGTRIESFLNARK